MIHYYKIISVVTAVLLFIYDVYSEDSSKFPTRHILVTPSRLLAASPNRICLSRLGPATLGTATTQLDLLTLGSLGQHVYRNSTTLRPRNLARVRKTFPQGNGGCIDLLVPRTPFKKVVLQFRMRLDSQPQYKIVEKRELYIQHDINMVVIQTDKPLYRAGETVKFRVLQLKPDLTPLQIPVYRVFIETPPDLFGGPVKVVQWFNVSTQLGLMQREYQIDKYALQGEWRIVVENKEPWIVSTVQTFIVTDYSLPNYHITVEKDEDILSTLEYYSYNICAKYNHGEFVSGKLLVNVKSDSYISKTLLHEARLDSGRGCYNYTIETKSLGFGTNDMPKVIIADVALQEDGTKTWRNTTAVSRVVDGVVRVHFVTRQYTRYKAGLPYRMKVKVTDWKHRPVSEAKVQFCKIFNDHSDDEIDNLHEQQIAQLLYDTETHKDSSSKVGDEEILSGQLVNDCTFSVTDDAGYASYLFVMSDDGHIDRVKLKATVTDYSLKNLQRTVSDSPSATLLMYSYGNMSSDTVEIGHPTSVATNGELRIGSRQNFPVYMATWNVRKITPMTLHYLFVTRAGNIYRWGTTIQCPIEISLTDAENMHSAFSAYDTTVYSNGTEECPGRAQYTSPIGLYKMIVPIRISHIMCPTSTIIVYYMTPKGDIVVASRKFKVHECFYNKVHMQWSPSQVPPSTATTLHLRTPVPSPSLCLMSATSTAFRHIAVDGNSVDQSHQMQYRVLYALNSLLERRQNRTIFTLKRNLCFNDDSKDQDLTTNEYNQKTLQLFLSSGIEVLTDTIKQRIDCPKVEEMVEKPADLYIPDNEFSKDRTYFPETWLWDIHVVDAKGRLDVSVTVPDEITQWDCQVYCLSRFGIAVMSNRDSGVLKVMQPFFVDLVIPNAAKRGEDVQMYYKIFNYMDFNVPLSVNLEVTPSAAASIISHQAGDRISCLKKGQSVVSYFTLRGYQLRAVNITITVQIVNNALHTCGHNNDLKNIALKNLRDSVTKILNIEPEGFPMENHKSGLLCVDDVTNKTEYTWFMDKVKCSEDSENWFVSLVGDITGPMYMNMENLLSIPVGCGEQNMAMLAYNLVALEYVTAGKKMAAEIKEKAVNNLATGYQRQLRYRHPAGGFSAFGGSDKSPSIWLTAFCIAYLPNIASKIDALGGGHMERGVVDDAITWLLEKQMENGCFRHEGQVFHREMKGGLQSDTSSIALTAFVIISLIDSKSRLLKPSTVQNTQYCLAALKYHQLNQKRLGAYLDVNQDRVYSLALATLAQLKIDDYFKALESKNEVLAEKRSFVKRETKYEYYDSSFEMEEPNEFTEFVEDFDGDLYKSYRSSNYRLVDDLARDVTDVTDDMFTEPLIPEEKRQNVVEKDFLMGGGLHALKLLKSIARRAGDMMWWEAESLPVSIETTGYAMLSMLSVGGEENILDSMAAARWLSTHRTRKGGFVSTQDTLIGIRAVCSLRHALPGIPPSLRVNVKAPNRGRQLDIEPGERHKLHTVMVRAVDGIANRGEAKLTVGVQGRGCVLVQVTQRYNSLSRPEDTSPFRVLSKVSTDGTFSCKDNNSSCMCAAILEVCIQWMSPSSFPEMAMLEVQLPTGYRPDRTLLYQLIKKENILLRRLEESVRGDKIYMYLSAETHTAGKGGLLECYPFYLVGPQSFTQPASVRIYDYYHKDVSYEVNYTIPEACKSNRGEIPHEEPMDLVNEDLHQISNILADDALNDTEIINSDLNTTIVSDWDRMIEKQDLKASFTNDNLDNANIFMDRIDVVESSIDYINNSNTANDSRHNAPSSSEENQDSDSKASDIVDRASDVSKQEVMLGDEKKELTEAPLNDMFTKDWHVIDSVVDLDTPKTVEGVPPVFALPPPSFNKSHRHIPKFYYYFNN